MRQEFPIPSLVLVHGLRGFDKLGRARRPKPEYFPGVSRFLSAAGFEVLVPRLCPTATIPQRAEELKTAIRTELGNRPVIVIGHSLGGLDARYMVSRLGMDSQVSALITVGTPHRGTSFADWLIRLGLGFRPILRLLGIDARVVADLTRVRCRLFNDTVPDVPGVVYRSVAGECDRPWLGPEWQFPSRIVRQFEGPNDGVVSLASAQWGEEFSTWQGDHLNLVNWPNRRMRSAGTWNDRGADYLQLINGVCQRLNSGEPTPHQ